MSFVNVKVLRGVLVAGDKEYGVDAEVPLPVDNAEKLIAAGIVARVEAAVAAAVEAPAVEAPAKGKKAKVEADADL